MGGSGGLQCWCRTKPGVAPRGGSKGRIKRGRDIGPATTELGTPCPPIGSRCSLPHIKETAMTDIHDARILIMATDGFEQSELEKPLSKLREAGATVTVASPDKTMAPGKIRGWDHHNWGGDVPVDKTL